MKTNISKFIKFFIIWVSSNLSIPFWTLVHIHLTLNVYEDVMEIVASMGMNIVVAVGFWLDWQRSKKEF